MARDAAIIVVSDENRHDDYQISGKEAVRFGQVGRCPFLADFVDLVGDVAEYAALETYPETLPHTGRGTINKNPMFLSE